MSEPPVPIPLPPRFAQRSRIVRAIAAPGMAGIAVFVVSVVIAVVLVALRSHEPPADQSMAAVSEEVSANETESEVVLVHVVGEVLAPGIVEVVAGARISDAIEAAGGATSEAELSAVNLARVVVDGEQVRVPDSEELEAAQQAVTEAGALINLNTADVAALETLPRVGPALAQRIIDWRSANGSFSSVEQLLEVSGIGEKTLEGFRDRVTV